MRAWFSEHAGLLVLLMVNIAFFTAGTLRQNGADGKQAQVAQKAAALARTKHLTSVFACEEGNERNNAAIKAVYDFEAKAIGKEPAQAVTIRRETLSKVAAIQQLAPYRDCKRYASNRDLGQRYDTTIPVANPAVRP